MDDLMAVYKGEQAALIAFDNNSLHAAVMSEPTKRGARFDAFVIPIPCDTAKKL